MAAEQVLALEPAGEARQHPALPDASGAEDEHGRRGLPHERQEELEVAAVGRGVVALGSASHGGEVRLVEELGGRDLAADRRGVGEELARLVGRPDPLGVAHPGADGERGHDLRVRRLRELDDALPLRPREDAAEAGRRCRGRGVVGVVEVRRVRPRPADAHVGGTERRGQRAQARAGEVDRRALAEEAGVEARDRGLLRPRVRGGRLCRVRGGLVGRPEAPARHLDHLDVVRLVALVDLADLGHPARVERHGIGAPGGDGGQGGRREHRRDVGLHESSRCDLHSPADRSSY